MIVGSLFSGIGGIDLGLERAGMHVAWQCESDEYRRAVLAARFPGIECSPDVRDLHRKRLVDRDRSQPPDPIRSRQAEHSSVDLLCGGFPCQDLSVAGRRAGLLQGERSSLFFEYARIADIVLAAGGWLLIENVPGLLSSNGGRDYAVLLATLAELGFHDLAWRVLDSRHFGVAQRRRRVYILARRARGDRACQVLLEPTSSGRDPEAGAEEGQEVAGTLGSRTQKGGMRTTDLDGHGAYVVSVSENQRGEVLETSYAHQLTAGGDKPGQGYPAARTAHGVRRLTPTECERLQGFPDGWTDLGGTPDSKRYAALGDAVTVNVAEWIGRRLMEVAA